jgi:RNA polymerase sigma-70 factor, ECF subfamily
VETGEPIDFAEQVRHCAQELARDGVGALGGVYDVTASRLIRYASTLTRQRDDAEDAVQAALVRIALRPRVLADAHYPWAYLLKVDRASPQANAPLEGSDKVVV